MVLSPWGRGGEGGGWAQNASTAAVTAAVVLVGFVHLADARFDEGWYQLGVLGHLGA